MAIEIKNTGQLNKSRSPSEEKFDWSNILNKEISLGKSFGSKKKERFYSDLFTLFQAGVDLRAALELILQEIVHKKDKILIHGIYQNILKGSSFSKALEISGAFSPYEFYSIKIGEESGNLNHVLEQLANYYTRQITLKRQLTKVFSYPIFVLVLAFGVVYFMLRYIVPMFGTIFKRFGSELPLMTRKVISFSDWVVAYGPWILFSIFILILILYFQKNKIWFRKFSSQIIIRIPFFGDLIRKIYLARFCQSMEMLVASKTNLVEAFEMVEQMIGFYPIESAIKQIKEDLTKGQKLSTSMSVFPVFDKKLISLIKVAEEVNALDAMFGKLYKQYSGDVEHRTQTMGSVTEPLLMIVIGSIVGFILLALYLPMFNLSNTIR